MIYYAFISHSSKDEKVARNLWRFIEYYNIPASIRKQLKEPFPNRLRPIFWYRYDLTGPDLHAALEKELHESRYLILLCSPDAAKSVYVNDEVESFIKAGRADKIVPVILRGMPYSEDPEKECFPKSLLDFSKESGITYRGPNIEEEGKTRSYINVLASLLGVRSNVLYQRHQRRKQKIIIAALCFLFGILGLWGLYHHRMAPSYKYYEYITDVCGLPTGVLEVSVPSERMYSYKIEYRRATPFMPPRTTSIYCVNSCDKPITYTDRGFYIYGIIPRTEYPIIRVKYNEFGTVSGLEFQDETGTPCETYTYVSNNGIVASIVDIGNINLQIGDLPTGLIEDRTENICIRRLRLDRDTSGFVSRITFHSNNGALKTSRISDIHGAFGYRIERDSLGLPRRIEVLNEDYELKRNNNGYAIEVANETYSDQYYYDVDGVTPVLYNGLFHHVHREFDTYGNIVSESVFNTSEQPDLTPEGYHKSVSVIKHGLVEDEYVYDIHGDPTWETKKAYHHKSYEYNAMGQQITRRCYGVDNNPSLSMDGYHMVKFVYNKHGHLIGESYFDTDGKPTLCKRGYSIVRQSCDKMGRVTEQACFDINNEPCLTSEGFHSTKVYYNGLNGRIPTKQEYFGVDGKPTYIKDGYSSFSLVSIIDDEDNAKVIFTYYDTKGCRIHNINIGASIVQRKFSPFGQLIEEEYFDSSHKPMLNRYGVSKIVYQYDDTGYQTSCHFYDQEGQLCNSLLGYAYELTTYSNSHIIKHSRYYNQQSEPTHTFFGPPEVVRENAGLYSSITFKDNGDISESPNGFSRMVTNVDKVGGISTTHYYDSIGNPCQTTRDSIAYYVFSLSAAGLYTEARAYGLDNQLHRALDFIGVPIVKMGYDHKGNLNRMSFWKDDNTPMMNNYGFHIKNSIFNQDNQLVEESYYDKDGDPVIVPGTGAKVRYSYDSRRQLVGTSFYGNGIKDELILTELGYAEVSYSYDERGNMIDIMYYDEDHELTNCTLGYAHQLNSYGERCELLTSTFYDAFNEQLKCIEYTYDDGFVIGINESFPNGVEYETKPIIVVGKHNPEKAIVKLLGWNILSPDYYRVQLILPSINEFLSRTDQNPGLYDSSIDAVCINQDMSVSYDRVPLSEIALSRMPFEAYEDYQEAYQSFLLRLKETSDGN